MSNSKEIRTKIASIKSTQKITNAMQLVAASKIRKAQARMQASMPYAERIRFVVGHVAGSHSEFHSPFLEKREEVKRVGYIVVSSDRGLCGGLNINLFKKLLEEMQAWQKQGVEIDLCLIGTKAELFFKNKGVNIVAQISNLGDNPKIADIIGSLRIMSQAYRERNIDRLYITYNEFINTMIQKPKTAQLLPLELAEEENKGGRYWDYIYEPDTEQLLIDLLRRFGEAEVYQAIIDNIACEQAARMVAMKNATDNAAELIDGLQLLYNKTRQADITQEITEIVGGAEAV
ncbi:MAG: F0F1 ATP synthase subunit gamma [Gammaproteobacteria bacterium]|nr:F0F1 ATP synthase subunit gamma [Gammaproteobacteria bacterium]